MKYSTTLSCLLAVTFFALAALAQQEKYRIKGDYLDVPVRSGYRIMGNDDDGFLEDGIIVKTKGTGYIDQRYRKRYEQPIPQASYQKLYYAVPVLPKAAKMYPMKYAHVPEIIYGRREW